MGPIAAGANGQFLGERRFLTLDEQCQAVEVFIAKLPKLSHDEQELVRAGWNASAVFTRVAGFDGFEEALAALRGQPAKEPSLTT